MSCSIFFSTALADSTKTMKQTPMNTISFEVTKELKIFNDLDDIVALKTAINLLVTMNKDVHDLDSKNFHAEKLILWLNLLNSIDAKVVHNFNSNDAPALHAMPPEGAQIPVGASPDAIKDPELREKYIKNIKSNQNQIRVYDFQYRLQELNERATAGAFDYIKKIHVRSAINKNNYIKLVEQIVVAEDRKKSLLKFAIEH